MKAQELLRLYQDGKRDFSGEDLRGMSFKNQNLSGANFANTNLRGTNFCNAILRQVDFSYAKVGLKRSWAITIVLASWFFAAVCGALSVFWGSLVSLTVVPGRSEAIVFGWIALAIFGIYSSVTLLRGNGPGFSVFGFISAVGIAIAVSLRLVSEVHGVFGLAIGIIVGTTGTIGIQVAAAVSGFSISILTRFNIKPLLQSGADYNLRKYRGLSLSQNQISLAGTTVAAIFAIVGASTVCNLVSIQFASAVAFFPDTCNDCVAGDSTIASITTLISTLLSTYFGWRALVGDQKYGLIRAVLLALTTIGGTDFRGANLTDAKFCQVHFNSTDFRDATLIRTCWKQSQNLDRVRPGGTYLKNTQVRALLQSSQASGVNFESKNLRGINLQGANLADASFRAADLSESNLQDADLSRAILVQAQLDQTNLTGATLTAACIEDWGITGDTQLQGVRCEYVYMRWVKSEDPDQNPHRKPDNWSETFSDGEFGDFIKPIVDTLDLYHSQDIDPRAIAISFRQLAADHPEAELRIKALEIKGDNKVLLRAKTSEIANHSELNQTYFQTYNHIRTLPNSEVQLLLAEKDERISSLEKFVETALKCPSFYAENYHQQGDFMSDKPINIQAGGNISGVINLGEIQGDVNNEIQRIPDSSQSNQSNLKDLLNQLQAAIVQESAWNEMEKAAALEQIKKLAKAGHAPQESKMQQLAKRATGMLKGMVSSLAEGAKLVTAWDKLGPAIMALFSLS